VKNVLIFLASVNIFCSLQLSPRHSR